MTPLLVLLVLAQAQPERVGPRVGLQLEQGFERYEGDSRLFLNTRLGADLEVSERVVLRADVSRIDKFGKSGFGTGLLADIRVGKSLRLLPGVSLGDPDVLAVSSTGVGAVYSGLHWWPGFVLTGWLTLYSFADSRSVATSLGVVQYYKRFWFQYNFRYAQGLNIEVPGLAHELSAGARFNAPVRFELGVSVSGGNDAYLASYLEQPARVELRGLSADVRTRFWVLRNAGFLATASMGNQWWKSGEPAFFRRAVSVGLWTEL